MCELFQICILFPFSFVGWGHAPTGHHPGLSGLNKRTLIDTDRREWYSTILTPPPYIIFQAVSLQLPTA